MKVFTTFIALLLLTTMFLPKPASAEAFLDLYGGASFSEPDNVRINSKVATTSGHVRYKDDLTYGVRSGYWFNNQPWLGIAGDLSAMHARGDDARFDLMPFTPMVLFRIPLLADEGAPHGRLQPYVGAGPSLSLYTYGSANFGPPTNGINNWDINWGYQIPAGMAVQLSRHFALFGEYRYANFRVKVTRDRSIFGGSSSPDDAQDVQTRLQIHNMLFGLSFRF